MSRTFCLLTTLIALILAVGLFQWPPSVLSSSQAGDPSSPPAITGPNTRQPVELPPLPPLKDRMAPVLPDPQVEQETK